MPVDLGKILLAGLLVAFVVYVAVEQGYIKLPTKETEETTGGEVAQREVVREVIREVPVTRGGGAFPIETLYASAKDKYTQADISGVEIQFWMPGADPSDPNQKPLDKIVITNGKGTTTNAIIQTNTEYDIYFNGSSTYYDDHIEDWVINYNPDTGKGTLNFIIDGTRYSYYPAAKVGTFVDLDTLPEKHSCLADSGTDEITYNETLAACTGSVWWKMDVGNADANSELHEVVMCFRDSDGDMEGNELTGLTATYVSGSTNINIPGSLIGYWKDGMGGGAKRCLTIATVLGSGERARWEFSATVDESNAENGEEFEICFDDNGDLSRREYPSGSLKASYECLTFKFAE